MGNIVASFVSGFTRVFSSLFGAPLDFLAGKSCSKVCGSTWDLICYIENFCIGNLLKLVVVLALFYVVLLFIYLLYKAGICDCIGRNLCKMAWAVCSSCFYSLEYGCMFSWIKLRELVRVRREHVRDILEEYDVSDNELTDESFSYRHAPRAIELKRSFSRRSGERRRIHISRSLRPRSHRIRVGIGRDSAYANREVGRHVKTVHDIKVTQTSKFVQKGNANRVYQKRRRRR